MSSFSSAQERFRLLLYFFLERVLFALFIFFGDGFGEIFGGEPEPCSMRVA